MDRKRHLANPHRGERRQGLRTLLGAAALLVAGCSLQDLGYLGYPDSQDGGLSGSLNLSGTGGHVGRGGSGSSNGGNGGTASGGSGGAGGAGGGGAGVGGSAGTGGSGSGGTSGGVGAGGTAGTAPVNFGGSAGYLGSDTLPDGGPSGNLIEDPGFEAGIAGWAQQGAPTLTWSSLGPAAGSRCLKVGNRSADWNGALYSLKDLVVPGETYAVSAYMRVSHPFQPVKLTTKATCSGESAVFGEVATGEASTSWRLFEGTFVAPTCTVTQFGIEAEGAPVNVDIYVDEIRVVLVP